MLGDVRRKYIPVRRKFSAGLVISPPDKIFVYMAMYVGPFRPSVTGPQLFCEFRPLVIRFSLPEKHYFTDFILGPLYLWHKPGV